MILNFHNTGTRINNVPVDAAKIETPQYTILIMLCPYNSKEYVPSISIYNVNALNIMKGYKFTGKKVRTKNQLKIHLDNLIQHYLSPATASDTSYLINHLKNNGEYHHKKIGQTVNRINQKQKNKQLHTTKH